MFNLYIKHNVTNETPNEKLATKTSEIKLLNEKRLSKENYLTMKEIRKSNNTA